MLVVGMAKITLTLGAEHDERLQGALMSALNEAGASIGKQRCALGGSQELIELTAALGVDRIAIESETYVGLKLSGEQRTVERIAQRTREIYAGGNFR